MKEFIFIDVYNQVLCVCCFLVDNSVYFIVCSLKYSEKNGTIGFYSHHKGPWYEVTHETSATCLHFPLAPYMTKIIYIFVVPSY